MRIVYPEAIPGRPIDRVPGEVRISILDLRIGRQERGLARCWQIQGEAAASAPGPDAIFVPGPKPPGIAAVFG
ncbi:MAG: hypothetical protein GYB66_10930 [Chloroflexi bacterium]|nr:hypothetical protein [Chloroflexota bacterium]